MKILFITSTIVSIIVITLLVVVNVVYNKDLSKNVDTNSNTNADVNSIRPTDTSKHIQPTNIHQGTFQPITSIFKRPTNTIKDTLQNKTIEIKCNKPFYIEKVIVYMMMNVNKIEFQCGGNKTHTIELNNNTPTKEIQHNRTNIPTKRIEFTNKNGFKNVFIQKKEKVIEKFIVSENLVLEETNYSRFICPNFFKLSGIIRQENNSNLIFKIICIEVI